jgi:hypothetical protein
VAEQRAVSSSTRTVAVTVMGWGRHPIHVSMEVPERLYRLIEVRAQTTGRSVEQECVRFVERSFPRQLRH